MTTETQREDKISTAAGKINASAAADGDGYVYHADETNEWYRVAEDDLIDLYELMHSDDPDIAADAYSHWCSGSNAEELSSPADVLIAVGPDGTARCQCGEITGERCQGNPIRVSRMVTVEWMPESLRESHRAAGNSGVWPHNGSLRLMLDPECAAALRDDDPDFFAVLDGE